MKGGPIEVKNNNDPARRAYVRTNPREEFVLYTSYPAADTILGGTTDARIGPVFIAANIMVGFGYYGCFRLFGKFLVSIWQQKLRYEKPGICSAFALTVTLPTPRRRAYRRSLCPLSEED